MNKLIKCLIESLFDDIDDIVDNDATQSIFTQKVIDDELNTLKNKSWNKTEYPTGYSNIEKAKNLYNIGELFITGILYVVPYRNLDYYEMRCKFSGYNIEGPDDYIEITMNKHKVCSIYVNDNNINKIIIYVDWQGILCKYVTYNLKKHYVNISTYFLMNLYIKNNYNIKSLFIKFEDEIPSIKNIYTTFNDRYPFISDNINTYENTFVIYKSDEKMSIPLVNTWKNAFITISSSDIFDNLKTFDDFLNYFKKHGCKRYRMESQPQILHPGKYKGFYYGEDLFNQFVIDNNFEQYLYKSDKTKIEVIINDKTFKYLNDKGYKEPYHFMSSIQFGDKSDQGKDQHGNFIKIRYKCDFDDEGTNKHIYSTNIWKFYKSGLCVLDKVETFNSI